MEFSNTIGALKFITGIFLLRSLKGARRFIWEVSQSENGISSSSASLSHLHTIYST